MYTLHAIVLVRPAGAIESGELTVGSATYATAAVESGGRFSPFDVSFDQVVERLGDLPGMFCEPDGSFVWVAAGEGGETVLPDSKRENDRWQLDGQLTDRNERLLSIELSGRCPPEAFDRLLSVLGWPEVPLLFQLMQEGVHLGEAEFRRWAAAER